MKVIEFIWKILLDSSFTTVTNIVSFGIIVFIEITTDDAYGLSCFWRKKKLYTEAKTYKRGFTDSEQAFRRRVKWDVSCVANKH